jgi:hypothetical protein
MLSPSMCGEKVGIEGRVASKSESGPSRKEVARSFHPIGRKDELISIGGRGELAVIELADVFRRFADGYLSADGTAMPASHRRARSSTGARGTRRIEAD